jgi:N-acetylneuraminic acid mutarotase
MPTPRCGLAVVSVNGVIYAIGGSNSSTVEAYDASTDHWTTKASMHTARERFGAAVLNGTIYAAGGSNTTNSLLASSESYDPATDTWTSVASLGAPRADLTMSTANGNLLAIGGSAAAGFTG